MLALRLIIQILFVIVSPFFMLLLGAALLRWGMRLVFPAEQEGEQETLPLPLAACYVFGLLFYLTCIFVLAALGCYLPLAALAPLLLLLVPALDACAVQRLIAASAGRITLHFAFWCSVVMILGVSLISASKTIQTPWANNYGDVAFHVGMITSFVFGDNLPPEYHIFPGERLSYPFYVNLWTASLWSIYPVFSTLPMIFAAQWCSVWIVVYFLLNGNRRRLAPWAVLFGGGTYSYVFTRILADPSSEMTHKPAHAFLNQGQPWAPFLTTIWVTQRPALIGLCVLLAVCLLLHRFLCRTHKEGLVNACAPELAAAGALLGLAPLAHTHFFIVAVCYAELLLAASFLKQFAANSKTALPLRFKEAGRNLLVFNLPLACAVFFLPWLLGKTGIISFSWGWFPGRTPGISALHSLVQTFVMWVSNSPAWFLLFFVLFTVRALRLPVLLLVLLFVAGNFVQLAVWDWDQLKVFLALYVISISLVVCEENQPAFLINLVFLILVLPALYETGTVFLHYDDYTVYSEDDLKKAEVLRRMTPPRAVILAAPHHNSPVTLSGRRLFSGYEGTTHSHGLPYLARKSLMESPEDIRQCAITPELAAGRARVCPGYLLWSIHEQNYWKLQHPGGAGIFTSFPGEELYRIWKPE